MPASNNSLFFMPEVNHRLILRFAVRKTSSRISAQIAPIRMLPATTNTTALTSPVFGRVSSRLTRFTVLSTVMPRASCQPSCAVKWLDALTVTAPGWLSLSFPSGAFVCTR